MTGCETCDQHNRPMLSEDGTLIDLAIDLHRVMHDFARALVGPLLRWLETKGEALMPLRIRKAIPPAGPVLAERVPVGAVVDGEGGPVVVEQPPPDAPGEPAGAGRLRDEASALTNADSAPALMGGGACCSLYCCLYRSVYSRPSGVTGTSWPPAWGPYPDWPTSSAVSSTRLRALPGVLPCYRNAARPRPMSSPTKPNTARVTTT